MFKNIKVFESVGSICKSVGMVNESVWEVASIKINVNS